MKTAPLKVLLLGWDTPAPTTDTPPTSALLQALAPHVELTLLLPRLSEPMQLSSLFQTTGLGNLTAEELVLLEATYESNPSQTWQPPASPYLGATLSDQQATSYSPQPNEAQPAPAELPSPASEFTASDELPDGSIGVREAMDLASIETELTFNADEFEGNPTPFSSAETTDQNAAEAAPAEFLPIASAPELSVRNSILDVAMAALQALPTDEASLNFRVIQYARLATRLAATQNFSVIYASDWQSWLAGMEIRQLTGKPLVLHVYSLAQVRNTPADRGWVAEMERMALRRADLVLTATSDLALRVIELYEVAPQRVRRLSPAAHQEPDLLAETILSALREVY